MGQIDAMQAGLSWMFSTELLELREENWEIETLRCWDWTDAMPINIPAWRNIQKMKVCMILERVSRTRVESAWECSFTWAHFLAPQGTDTYAPVRFCDMWYYIFMTKSWCIVLIKYHIHVLAIYGALFLSAFAFTARTSFWSTCSHLRQLIRVKLMSTRELTHVLMNSVTYLSLSKMLISGIFTLWTDITQ